MHSDEPHGHEAEGAGGMIASKMWLSYLGVSKNRGFSPQIIHFDRVFHYKPSILRYPYCWKHPFGHNDLFIRFLFVQKSKRYLI